MKLILSAFLFVSLPALARTPDQCATPGEVLNREFTGLSGDAVKASFYRDGTAEISTSGVLNGTLETKTYKNFKVSTCETTVENYQEEACADVSLDLALGRGNSAFKSLFDLNTTLLKRAQLFATTVSYSLDQAPAVRLDLANQVVVQLTRNASTVGIPRTFAEFTALLAKSVADGYITQALLDDVTVTHLAENTKALGFAPLEGVQFKEGAGNGKLQKLFDLTVSSQVRATLIQSTLDGVSDKSALALSKSFIDFATTNGVPENWAQFVLMMKASVSGGAITQDEFTNVTGTLEQANRHNLGFDLTSFVCKMENRTRNVNVITVNTATDFLEVVKRSFKITLLNAPLLLGERETYDVNWDGVNKMGMSYNNLYNSYTITERSDENGLVTMKVTGARNRVGATNTVAAQVVRDGKVLNLRVQNKGYNAAVGGKVMIQVEFFEDIPLWPDRRLSTQVYELPNGDAMEINSKIEMKNPNHKHYAKISLQIVGSKYFNEEYTQPLEYKE